jgi:hypothetical protein
MPKKYDLCELNFQTNQLRTATKALFKQADQRTYTPDEDHNLSPLALKNKIRVGRLVELMAVLETANNIVAKIREYPIDDLEVEI